MTHNSNTFSVLGLAMESAFTLFDPTNTDMAYLSPRTLRILINIIYSINRGEVVCPLYARQLLDREAGIFGGLSAITDDVFIRLQNTNNLDEFKQLENNLNHSVVIEFYMVLNKLIKDEKSKMAFIDLIKFPFFSPVSGRYIENRPNNGHSLGNILDDIFNDDEMSEDEEEEEQQEQVPEEEQQQPENPQQVPTDTSQETAPSAGDIAYKAFKAPNEPIQDPSQGLPTDFRNASLYHQQ